MVHQKIYTDNLSIEDIKIAHKKTKFVFKCWLCLALSIEIGLLSLNVFTVYIWPDICSYIQIIFRFPTFLRIVTGLFVILFSDIEMVNIAGTGDYHTAHRHFFFYPCLGIWMLTGLIDLYLLGFTLVADIIFFLVVHGYQLYQIVYSLIFDVLYISEFYASVYFVYRIGVIENLQHNEAHKKVFKPGKGFNKKKKKKGSSSLV